MQTKKITFPVAFCLMLSFVSVATDKQTTGSVRELGEQVTRITFYSFYTGTRKTVNEKLVNKFNEENQDIEVKKKKKNLDLIH